MANVWDAEEEDCIEEFCDIIRELNDGDLDVLHQALDSAEPYPMIRKLRDKITKYSDVFNAFSACGITSDPIKCIKAEMASRVKSREEIEQENVDLRDMVIAQRKQLDRALYAIYQLHGGLYNQITQSNMLHFNNALLYNEPLPEFPLEEENWPTTRQGDAHEKRIQQLEQTICALEEKIDALDKRQQQTFL
uniref:Uncharacterized protein n=1 Tax=viral metagenome TaxID=1070528 RepID=A0A6C0IHE2_9ZZZZ